MSNDSGLESMLAGVPEAHESSVAFRPAWLRHSSWQWYLAGAVASALAWPLAFVLWGWTVGWSYDSVHYGVGRMMSVYAPCIAYFAACGWVWPPWVVGFTGLFSGVGLANAADKSWSHSYQTDGLESFGVWAYPVIATIIGLAIVLLAAALRFVCDMVWHQLRLHAASQPLHVRLQRSEHDSRDQTTTS